LHLLVWAEIASALSRNVALGLCAPFLISGLTPSLIAPVRGTPLLVAHRHRHEQHHKHDRTGDRDHDDASTNCEDDEGAHATSP
jgi:hypothetical protein